VLRALARLVACSSSACRANRCRTQPCRALLCTSLQPAAALTRTVHTARQPPGLQPLPKQQQQQQQQELGMALVQMPSGTGCLLHPAPPTGPTAAQPQLQPQRLLLAPRPLVCWVLRGSRLLALLA
jgi:hypothetical protein